MEYHNGNEIVNVSTRQEKYRSSKFEDSLEVSHEIVNIVCGYLQDKFLKTNNSFAVRSGDDVIAYKTPDGRSIRLWDIEFIIDGKTKRFECKDFCRCVFYRATGLERRYVDRMLQYTSAEDIYIIFRDNPTFIEQYVNKTGRDASCARNVLLRDGFFKIADGKDTYVPYGEKLSVLMKNRNLRAEEKVKSSFGKFGGGDQYLWDISCMKTLGKIVEEIKGIDFGRKRRT